MTNKEHVDKLSRMLRTRLPDVALSVDAPSRPKGDWFIDAKLGKRSLTIEYRPGLGYGLSSTPSEAIGEGPDEFFEDEVAVVDRIAQLVHGRKKTEPQRVRLLQELRERMQVSQMAVADKLRVRQPTISKIERREDMNLSTLRRYVQALGGELQVTARFPDGSIEIGEQPRSRKRAGGGRP